jgi:hypothetical protein
MRSHFSYRLAGDANSMDSSPRLPVALTGGLSGFVGGKPDADFFSKGGHFKSVHRVPPPRRRENTSGAACSRRAWQIVILSGCHDAAGSGAEL